MIHVDGAKSRPTAPGMTAGVVYLFLMNHGDDEDTLIGLSTPIADRAEIHRTITTDGMTRMESVPRVTVRADDAILFEPGALHIMLFGLKQMLKPGDRFPLTLKFEHSGVLETIVAVQDSRNPDPGKVPSQTP